jgi:hypothetical protein
MEKQMADRAIEVANSLRDALNNYNALKSQGIHCPRECLDAADMEVHKAWEAYDTFFGNVRVRRD